ncbi:MAG: hypothetical protein HUK21_05865 [Fibrobacteraceae bacterium]|nr:hypothetical protein [Fibrobacteraceae bacterium]
MKNFFFLIFGLSIFALLGACSNSSSSENSDEVDSTVLSGINVDDGICTNCDSFTPSNPIVLNNGGKGSVTTYGSVTTKETSLGGACNYGQTNIRYYAAIHVNVSSGDNKGPWQGGLACGSCARVKAKTPTGYKTTVVRITDKCPDESCGIDLGGAPAYDIMGNLVGRYEGEWEFISCEGIASVYGDSTSIWVKEGASKYWSIIHVRNPPDGVRQIKMIRMENFKETVLQMDKGAENFWSVPAEILQDEGEYELEVEYRLGTKNTWRIKPELLTKEESTLYLYDYGK